MPKLLILSKKKKEDKCCMYVKTTMGLNFFFLTLLGEGGC